MPLSPTALTLLGLIAWALLLVVLLANQRGLLVLGGKLAVNAFAPDGSTTPGFGQRLTRAHANCLENLPLQAPVLLYALHAGQSALTDPLAPLLLGARLFQSVMHLISTAPLFVWLRFAGFLVQVVILAWWLLRLSGLL
ncbi:MAPEG family protein [Pseudomonas cavernae]|uniref:MAPEG family protein n=1 Tax=Pseudomonas cavernae TaxID=2320867 RepID=A0A385Z8M0_9PSED|nr:MAPEG family protein [Pseudomonas cavernae]AYC34393.1 MAPEG family protein [Pseudomonas cavernae]